MHRMMTAAGLTPAELMRYCGFMWCWVFEEYARADWPAGRFVLLADMSGLKLAQAVGEGQVGRSLHEDQDTASTNLARAVAQCISVACAAAATKNVAADSGLSSLCAAAGDATPRLW